MIGALEGIVFSKNTHSLILMIGGVGYRVTIVLTLLQKLHQNDHVFLHVYTHVREDTLELFGFEDASALHLFELLLTVSGIGPKTALLIMDRGAEVIQRAIIKSDVTFFTSIPRVGRKNAQKIIIELKNKLGSIEELDLSEEGGATLEVMNALQSLGFSQHEIRKILPEVTMLPTVEEQVKKALKLLGRR